MERRVLGRWFCLLMVKHVTASVAWNFGADANGYTRIAHRTGEMTIWDKNTYIILAVDPCMQVKYVRVEITNMRSEPEVTYNMDNHTVHISYAFYQISSSTYDVVAKGIRNPLCGGGKDRGNGGRNDLLLLHRKDAGFGGGKGRGNGRGKEGGKGGGKFHLLPHGNGGGKGRGKERGKGHLLLHGNGGGKGRGKEREKGHILLHGNGGGNGRGKERGKGHLLLHGNGGGNGRGKERGKGHLLLHGNGGGNGRGKERGKGHLLLHGNGGGNGRGKERGKGHLLLHGNGGGNGRGKERGKGHLLLHGNGGGNGAGGGGGSDHPNNNRPSYDEFRDGSYGYSWPNGRYYCHCVPTGGGKFPNRFKEGLNETSESTPETNGISPPEPTMRTSPPTTTEGWPPTTTNRYWWIRVTPGRTRVDAP